jgi:potassium efflux system protein
MPDIEQLGDVLDTETLTLSEVVIALAIIIISVVVARYVRRIVRATLAARPNIDEHVPETVARVVGWAIVLWGAVLALIVIGIQMGPLVLLLLFFGGMFGISARGILENFASGIALQITAPFRVGDHIETNGVTGWVKKIDSRAVVITALDRREVQVPNRDVFNNIVYNTSDVDWRRYELPFTIAYGEDLSRARSLVIEAVTALQSVYDDPMPVCYIHSLGSDGAEFRLRFYHEFETRIATRDEVAQTVIETLLAAGIKAGHTGTGRLLGRRARGLSQPPVTVRCYACSVRKIRNALTATPSASARISREWRPCSTSWLKTTTRGLRAQVLRSS